MLRLLVVFVTLALASTAAAQHSNFNYINGGWQVVKFDTGFGGDVDGDELFIGGAFAISDEWHIVAGYASTDLDFGVGLDQLEIGAGYHDSISSNAVWFAELLFVQADASVNGFGSLDESGIGARLGIRSNISDAIELNGAISYVDLGNGADGTSLEGAGWYSVSRTFSVGLLASFDDDVTTYGLGGRVYF